MLVQQDGGFTILFTLNQAEVKVDVPGQPQEALVHLAHLTVFYNLFSLVKENAAHQERGLTVSKIGYLGQSVKPPNRGVSSSTAPPPQPRTSNPSRRTPSIFSQAGV